MRARDPREEDGARAPCSGEAGPLRSDEARPLRSEEARDPRASDAGRGLRIGCIGWGSLLWDPRTLPMAGPFRPDGPWLPIEFSRVSLDGRVTLVLDPEAPPVRTAWAPLTVTTLESAVEGLGVRERIARERWQDWVGVEVRGEPGGSSGETPADLRAPIVDWLVGRTDLDAVVWTALPARGPDGITCFPGLERLLAHLATLEGDARARAEEYVRRAPAFVRSPRRVRFEAELGWTPVDRPAEPRQAPVPGPVAREREAASRS